MAWRFKASKFKNAAPIVPKPDAYVRELCIGSYQTYGSNIAASARFMAFNWDHAGSCLALLPIDDAGRKGKTLPLLHAHTDTVTDLAFSPFHDGLLATGSQDCLVKLWHIPAEGLQESLATPECTFSHKQRRVEGVGFHPTADFLLHSTSYTTLTLWDLVAERDVFNSGEQHTEVIQSVSWKRDGTLLATSCKDKQVRIVDPRVERCCVQTANGHNNIKDSKVVWLGEQQRILTTGFDGARLRQVMIRDLRNFARAEKTLELDCSTGILVPLYDADTGMLFLAGKGLLGRLENVRDVRMQFLGDTTISYMEVTDKEPFLIEGLRHNGEQTKGVCLVPKRALNVMQGEVNRILQLTSNSVIPITYQVPRKTYRDFHADLYPDTPGYITELTAATWWSGKDIPLAKISLDPAKRSNGDAPITVHRGSLAQLKEQVENMANSSSKGHATTVSKNSAITRNEYIAVKEKPKAVDREPIVIEKAQVDIDDNECNWENGNHVLVPPKPMPRTSRTGSICESVDEQQSPPKPVARPRTNSCAPTITSVSAAAPLVGGYKPRLGPKPFTPPKLNETESFDKVFNVPRVPCAKTQNGTHDDTEKTDETDKNDENPVDDETSNESVESISNNDSGYVPRTPTTAERRKLFEANLKERKDEEGSTTEPITKSDDIVDEGVTTVIRKVIDDESPDSLEQGDFVRASAQRTSIAERRRMYETRSASVQEQPTVASATMKSAERGDSSPIMLRRKGSFKNQAGDAQKEEHRKTVPVMRQQSDVATPTPKRTSTVFGRVSKFRHLKGTPAHKSFHIENVRNVSRQIPGECDGFQANPERVAVPLSGAGGKMAIIELSHRGRLPDGVIPALVHGSNIMDFCWDPFDHTRLAVACDDGIIRLWTIPAGGLTEQINVPAHEITAHNDKIYFIKFHPLAKDVLASGSYDMSVRIWDLTTLTERIVLTGHAEQIFSYAWSPCGAYCATASKDGRLRVYKPRAQQTPLREGRGPVGSRGARVVWALEGAFIVVTGFDKVSERQIIVFKASDLTIPLNTIGLDVSPAILIPFYDEDSSTLFVTGKGDSTVYAFEVTEEAPFLCALSHHRCGTLHQGLSFLPKNVCDVTNVEFAKAFRLTNNTIEPLSFTVPRIKTDLFQDDLFPPTKVMWAATMSAAEWFASKDKTPKRISLKPEGMLLLSSAQGQATSNEKVKAQATVIGSQPIGKAALTDEVKAKQEEIQKAVSNRLEVNTKLEQDEMEGVDEREWDE